MIRYFLNCVAFATFVICENFFIVILSFYDLIKKLFGGLGLEHSPAFDLLINPEFGEKRTIGDIL